MVVEDPVIQMQMPGGAETMLIRSITVRINDGPNQVLIASDCAPDRSPHSPAQHRLLFALIGDLNLGRDERLAIAQQVLQRDVTTYQYLSAYEAGRLIDTLRGYTLVLETLRQRVAGIPPRH